mgnify:CR=1 FL=1
MMDAPGAVESPDFLVRSRNEVVRLLNGIMQEGALISISFMSSDDVAVSKLIEVDEPGNLLLLECPPDWRSITERHNGVGSIMLDSALGDAKIQFQSGFGEVADLNDALVLILNIPEFMWRFQRRRDARQKVSGLKITLNLGFLASEAEVADIGMGGVCVLNCDSALKLETGEVLSGCAIALPGVGQIAMELTIQHQTPMKLADGSEVRQVGCQFTRLDESTQQLIAHYLEALTEV